MNAPQIPDTSTVRAEASDLLELTILKCLARGLTLEGTASELGYHVNTIKYHVRRIRDKHGFTAPLTGLAVEAISHGILCSRTQRQVIEDFVAQLRWSMPDDAIWASVRLWLERETNRYLEIHSV